MKYSILFFVLTSLVACKAPKRTAIDPSLLEYEKVVMLSEISKPKLFVLANKWMVETFNSAESVIEYSDKDSGTIIGKYIFAEKQSDIKSIIQIDVREMKCRIHFKNPTIKNIGQDLDFRKPKSNEALILINERWNALANEFQKFVESTTQWE